MKHYKWRIYIYLGKLVKRVMQSLHSPRKVCALYAQCLQVKVEMCIVGHKWSGKLLTHLSLCSLMERSINGFFHDKPAELNVFPWPHPFTPGLPGKITKQEERKIKEGLVEDYLVGQGKLIGERNLSCSVFSLQWIECTAEENLWDFVTKSFHTFSSMYC